MAYRKTQDQRIQEFSDYKKQHEFFVVAPAFGTASKPKTCLERLNSWYKMCQETNLKLADYAVEGSSAVLRFENGLQLSDSGHRVSFSATEDKQKVDMASAMTTIRCAANHLCRQGWDLGVDFSTVRYGSAKMVLGFEEAHREARRILNTERIALLRKSPRTAG